MQSKIVDQLKHLYIFLNQITRSTLIFVSHLGRFDEKLIGFEGALNGDF